MPHRILVCEDDAMLAATLKRALEDSGHCVTVCATGAEALAHLHREDFSLLVLDLMLPDMDGYDVCRRLRRNCFIPTLMISGRGGELDRIIGLEVGADDYLVKPFTPRELVARIAAHLRRGGDYAAATQPLPPIACGELSLDLQQHEVRVAGRLVHLTPKEFELLSALAERRGTVVRSAHLLLRVWGYDAGIRTRTLDVHIGRLRAKLEDDGRHPRHIITVPGVGYKLVTPEPSQRAA